MVPWFVGCLFWGGCLGKGLPQANIPTLIVGAGLLILLILLKVFAPKVPGARVAPVLGIGAATFLPLASLGVVLTGDVPKGLPSFVLPSLSLLTQNLGVVFPAAVGVLLVGFSESLAAARQYSAKYHYDIDIDQEMLAQGMTNTASGLFQGINVDGSLSKSSLNDSSGARTQMASIAQAVFVVLTLLFLAPLFSNLPRTALAAIVIQAVAFGLWKIPEMRRLSRLSHVDFWLALAALLGVLTFGPLQGVFIGLILSLLWLVWRASNPSIPVLGRTPDGSYHGSDYHLDTTTFPGLVILRLDGSLLFATANGLRNRLRQVTRNADPPVKVVILDLEGTDIIDLQGSDELAEAAKELKNVQIDLYLARAKTDIKRMLRPYGALATIPEDHFFDGVDFAVAAAMDPSSEGNVR